MFKLLFSALLITTSIAHADTKVGLFGSLLLSTTENDVVDDIDGSDEISKWSGGLGMRALVGLNDRIYVRTGIAYIKKEFEYDFNGTQKGNQRYSFAYLSIPATVYIKASPQLGIFGGTALQAKFDDGCNGSYSDGTTTTGCKIEDDNALVMPAILGFDVVLTDHISAEFSYEYALMETMKDTKVSSAVASLIYNL